MAFPVDILTTVDHESLEMAAKNYMSQLLYRNPDTSEYLSRSDSKQIQIGLCNVSFVPLYGADTKEKVLALFSPDNPFIVAGLYLLGKWWTVEDILKTADPSRTGLIKVSTLGERVVLYVLNRIVYRAKEKSSEDVPFLCHCEDETAKILWKDGEAIGFYSVKPKESLCSNFLTQRYQLPVMDTIFVRKCHRGNGHGLQILEDFVGSFRKEYLGFKFPLSKAMYKVCEKYFSMYPADKELLWEVEGIGGPFQRTLIASKLQKLKLKEKDQVVSKLNLEEDNTSAPVEIEITKIQETSEYTMEIVEEAITKVTKEVDDIPVTRCGRSSNLKRRGIREDSEERLSKNIIRVEDIEAGVESPIEVVTEEKLDNSTFFVKESEAVLKSTTVTVTAAVTNILVLRDSQKEEEQEIKNKVILDTVEDILDRPAIDLAKATSEEGLENEEDTPVTHFTTVGEIKSQCGREEEHETINKEPIVEIQGATIASYYQHHSQSLVDVEIVKMSTGIEEEQKGKLEKAKEGKEDEPVCEEEEEIKQMLDEPEKTMENANGKESEKTQEIFTDIEKIVEEEEMHADEMENENIDKADIFPEVLTAENTVLEQTVTAKLTEKEQAHRDVEKMEEKEKTVEDEETEENKDENMDSQECEAKDEDTVLQQSLIDKDQTELVAEKESVKMTPSNEEVPCEKPKQSETEQVFSKSKSAQKRISVIIPSRRSKRLRHQPVDTKRDLKRTTKSSKPTLYSKAMMQEGDTKETMDEPEDNDSEVIEETQEPQVIVEECKENGKLIVSTVEAEVTHIKETAAADPEVCEEVKGTEIESQKEVPQQSSVELAEVQDETMVPEEDDEKEGNGTMMFTLHKAKVVLVEFNIPSPKESGERDTIEEILHTQEEKESDKASIMDTQGEVGITEDGMEQTVSQLKTSEQEAVEELVRIKEEGTLDKPMDETYSSTITEGYELADVANRIPGQSIADKEKMGEPEPETTEVFHPSLVEKQEEKRDTVQAKEDEQDSGKDSDEADKLFTRGKEAQKRRPGDTTKRSRRLKDQPTDPVVTVRSLRGTIKTVENTPLRTSTRRKAVIQQVETVKPQAEKREKAELGNDENTDSDAEDAGPEESEMTKTNVEETAAVDPVSSELMKGAEIGNKDKAIVESTEDAPLLQTEPGEDVQKEENSTSVIHWQNATIRLVDVNKRYQNIEGNSETAESVRLAVDKSANRESDQYSMEPEEDKQLKVVDTEEETEKMPEKEKMEEENTVDEQNEPDKQAMTFKEQKPAEGVLETKTTEELEEGQNDVKETEILDDYKAFIYEAVEEATTTGEHPDSMENVININQETDNYKDNALKEIKTDSCIAGEKIEDNKATMPEEDYVVESTKNENTQNEDEEMTSLVQEKAIQEIEEEEAPVYTERSLRRRTVRVQSPQRKKSKCVQKQESKTQKSHTMESKDKTETVPITEKGVEEMDQEVDKIDNKQADLTEAKETDEEKEEAPEVGREEANLEQQDNEPLVDNEKETSVTENPIEMDDAPMISKDQTHVLKEITIQVEEKGSQMESTESNQNKTERVTRRSLRLSATPVKSSTRRISQRFQAQMLEPVEEADMSGNEHDNISATTKETVNIIMPIITKETNLKSLDEMANTNIEETTAVDPETSELLKGAEIDIEEKAPQIVEVTEEVIPLVETEPVKDLEKEEDSTPVLKLQYAKVMLVDVNKLSQKIGNMETAEDLVHSQREEELELDVSANIEHEQSNMESEEDKQQEIETEQDPEKMPEEEKMEEENTIKGQNEPDKQDVTFKEQKPAEGGVLKTKTTENLEERQNDVKETEIVDEYKAVIDEALEEAIMSGEHQDTKSIEDRTNINQETDSDQDNALKEKQTDSDIAGEKTVDSNITMPAEESTKNDNIQNEDEEMTSLAQEKAVQEILEEEAPVYTERSLRRRTVRVQSPQRKKSKHVRKQESELDVETQESHTVESKVKAETVPITENEDMDQDVNKIDNKEADLTEAKETDEEKEEAPEVGREEANLEQQDNESLVDNEKETSVTENPIEMDDAPMISKDQTHVLKEITIQVEEKGSQMESTESNKNTTERVTRRSLRLSATPVISSTRRTSQHLHAQKLDPVEEADMSENEHDKISATAEETVNIIMPIITIETNLKILDVNIEETTAVDPESSELLKGAEIDDEEKVPQIIGATEEEVQLVETEPVKDLEKEGDSTPVIKLQNAKVMLVDVNKLFQKTEGNSETADDQVHSQKEEELELYKSTNSEHERSNMELYTKSMKDRPNIIKETDNNQDTVLKEKQMDSEIAGENIVDNKSKMSAEEIVVESTKNENVQKEDEDMTSLAQDKNVQEEEASVYTERSLRCRMVRVHSTPRRKSKCVKIQESEADVETQESQTVESKDKAETVPKTKMGVNEMDQEVNKMENKKANLIETKEADEEEAAPEMKREEANLELQENEPSETSETKNYSENEIQVEIPVEGVQDKEKVQKRTVEEDSINQESVSQEENLGETNQNECEAPAGQEKAALESIDEKAPLITRKSLRDRTVTVKSTPRRTSKRHHSQEVEPEKEAMNNRCGNEKNSSMEETADILSVHTKENEPLNAEFENVEAKDEEGIIQLYTDEKAVKNDNVEEEGNEILVESMKQNSPIQKETQGEFHEEELGNAQKDTKQNKAQEESMDIEDVQKPKEQEEESNVQEEETQFQESPSVTEGMNVSSSELEETVVEKKVLRKRTTTVAATAPRKSKRLRKQEHDKGSGQVEEPVKEQTEVTVTEDVELKSVVQTAMVFEEIVEENNLGKETSQQILKDVKGTKSDGDHNKHEDDTTETGVGQSVDGQKDENKVEEQNNKKVEETDKTTEEVVEHNEEKEKQNLESSLIEGFTLELEEDVKSDLEGNKADKQSQVAIDAPKEKSATEEKSERSEEHLSDDNEKGLAMEKHVPQRSSSATASTTRRSMRLQFHEIKKDSKEDDSDSEEMKKEVQAIEQIPQRKRKAIADSTPTRRSKRHERGNIA
ncbi:trichohyalin-like [Myxocyprinus asiaticus]|uniref:trichohyalin-like n=1 Tax=Myxocyprinus asiaticus TaxID=70543 RepID=UPI0022223F82|nr:trichohyalin-like [Myxocyprinus asiaticus]XP_051549985.1 trichohyalin-like [Myxocyprinus asiaticus]